ARHACGKLHFRDLARRPRPPAVPPGVGRVIDHRAGLCASPLDHEPGDHGQWVLACHLRPDDFAEWCAGGFVRTALDSHHQTPPAETNDGAWLSAHWLRVRLKRTGAHAAIARTDHCSLYPGRNDL